MPQAALRVSDHINEILKHPVARIESQRWLSSLRFLTFDDANEDEPHGSNTELAAQTGNQHQDTAEPRGQCLPCEQRLPPPPGHSCAQHMFRFGLNDGLRRERELELYKFSDPCVHVRENWCQACARIPPFPNQGTVTRFRIRRVHAAGSVDHHWCTHFVAVSYCWSSESGDNGSGPYKVVEEDGSVRDIRAQNSTIDRVVAFARENGFRMIWIDQECINQTDAKEKELAIHSMDLVYLKAEQSIGLFQTRLEQRHLECLSMLCAHLMPSKLRNTRRGPLPAIEDRRRGARPPKFDLIRETVSMIVNDKWNTRAWVLQEAFSSSGNMVLLLPRAEGIDVRGLSLVCHEASQSELAVLLGLMQGCIARFAQSLPLAISGQLMLAKKRQPTRARTSTSERIQYFHPETSSSGGSAYINKRREPDQCSASVAVAYLRLRDLERVADKLAIVANMCGYRLRLNTTHLGKTQPSLAICCFVLAIINGDFSLMVPQLYRGPECSSIEFPGIPADFSWAHSLTKRIQDVQAGSYNPSGNLAGSTVAQWVSLSADGLSAIGNLWRVDRFVELRRLQTKHAESWLRLRRANGRSQPPTHTAKLATTHLLFEILDTLVSKGEKQLANAVLNSTSSPYWQREKDPSSVAWGSGIIESVDEFPPGLSVENRRGMFSLEPSRDGWFHQCWIVDRAMEKGGFWTGTLEATGPSLEADNASRGADGVVEIDDTSGGSEMATETTANVNEDPFSHSHQETGPGTLPDSHSQRMFMLNLMAKQMAHFYEIQEPEETTRSVDSYVAADPLNMAIYAQGVVDIAENKTKERKQRAVFDLDGSPDGSVRVLVPFQPVLESIPRPEMRSMAVSWVVEEVVAAVATAGTGQPQRKFRVTGMVQGMWQFTLSCGGRYTLV
ncbi:hypothetical protein RB601_001462 [Gaeumannomyces tritici]